MTVRSGRQSARQRRKRVSGLAAKLAGHFDVTPSVTLLRQDLVRDPSFVN
jgi:hypothetical protein